MKRFVAVLMLAGGLLVAGGASAVPVTWTIPATTLSGSGNSISGTFVYDADTNTTSNINLTQTNNSVSSTLTVAGVNDGGYVRFVVANSVAQQGAYLSSLNLTNAGGNVTITNGDLGIGACTIIGSGGLCNNIGGPSIAFNTSSVIVSAQTPAPSAVPTLSEWSQMLLGLLVLSVIGWHFHKQRSY